MAYLITKKGDKNLPTAFYIFFVALTAVLVVCTAASVLAPQNRDLMSMPYSQWAPIMEYVIIGGSVIFWILLLQSGKEKRRSYGLNSEHWEYIYSYDPVVYWIISSQICDCLCSERPAF